MVRLLIAGDLHTGHLLGLTPAHLIRKFKFSGLVHRFWDWWLYNTQKKYDIAVIGGDIVDGEGKKDSSHLLLPGIDDQKDAAKFILKKLNAKQYIFNYGSGYHTGQDQDHEKDIADDFGGNITTQQRFAVQGVKFDTKHTISKSTVPSGGTIQLQTQFIWNVLNTLNTDNKEIADYIIRFHAHEYRLLENDYNTVIICPALKIGMPDFDRYARKLNGYYSVGFLEFCIDKGKVVDYEHYKFTYGVDSGYKEICEEQKKQNQESQSRKTG